MSSQTRSGSCEALLSISTTTPKPRSQLAQEYLIGEGKVHREAPAIGVCPNRVKDLTTVLLVLDLAVLSLLMVRMATNKVDVEQAAQVVAAAMLLEEGKHGQMGKLLLKLLVAAHAHVCCCVTAGASAQ